MICAPAGIPLRSASCRPLAVRRQLKRSPLGGWRPINRHAMTTDWLLGFLSGVLATVLGFVLTMAWDLRKERRETRGRARVVNHALGADLTANSARIERNIEALTNELAVLPQRADVVQPLTLLRTGFWDIAKLYPPGEIVTADDLLGLHEVFDLTEQANEQMRSRETYRQHNSAMTNYETRLRIYDEVLLATLTRLRQSTSHLLVGTRTPRLDRPAA